MHHKTKGKMLKKMSCVLQVYLSGVVEYLQGIIPWATNWLMGLLNINLTLRAEKKTKNEFILVIIIITKMNKPENINVSRAYTIITLMVLVIN